MENRCIAEQRQCPAAMDRLKTGMLCCLLDDGLTLYWGNLSFFSRIGYSREGFCRRFHDLRQYYAQFPDAFTALRMEVAQAAEAGRSDLETTVLLPLKGGGHSWVHLYGTLLEDSQAGGPVLLAELAGVDALVAEKEEQAQLYRQKLQYFRWMLNTYEGNVYVSDMDTYELLYLNQHSCDVLGAPSAKLLGRKCYEVIQGQIGRAHV